MSSKSPVAPEGGSAPQPLTRYYIQYGIAGAAYDLFAHPNGDMVKFSDVQALQATVATLHATCAEYEKCIREFQQAGQAAKRKQ